MLSRLYPRGRLTAIFASQVQLQQLLPADIGAAAAYEAYRTWKHNSFLYEPLSADRELQREGLIGMAIAESTSFSSLSGLRWMVRNSKQLSSERSCGGRHARGRDSRTASGARGPVRRNSWKFPKCVPEDRKTLGEVLRVGGPHSSRPCRSRDIVLATR